MTADPRTQLADAVTALVEVTNERDAAQGIVEDLLDLLRDVRHYGVLPETIHDEITKWLGPVQRIATDGSKSP